MRGVLIEYPQAETYRVLLLFLPVVAQELSGASVITTRQCSTIPLAGVPTLGAGMETVPNMAFAV